MAFRLNLVLLAALLSFAAQAFAGTDATPGPHQLYGHITSNLTLTAAGPDTTYEIIGDLTVDPGVTLTIEHGVVVVVTSNSDYLAAGQNRSQVEITVEGALRVAAGSPPVNIRPSVLTPDTWPGLLVTGGGSVDFSNVTISGATLALHLSSGATVNLSGCHILGATNGLAVDTGCSAHLDGCDIQSAQTAATAFSGAVLSVSHTSVQTQGSGILFNTNSAGDVRACDIGGSESGTGISLPFSLTAADSVHPEPTYVRHFEVGVDCRKSGLRLDHMVFEGCASAVRDNVGALLINYCTFSGDATPVGGPGTGGAIYNSVVVDMATGLGASHQIDYTDWWSASGAVWSNVTVGGHVSSYDPFFVPQDAQYHLTPESFFTGFSVSGGQLGAFGPGDLAPTPVHSARVTDAMGAGGEVRVRWYVEAQGSSKAGIFRRATDGDWRPLTVLYSDAQGYVSLEDRDVSAGDRYEYGVGVLRGGGVGIEGQVWVTVDFPIFRKDMITVEPNPTSVEWSVGFLSPEPADTRIDVLDLSGRVVRSTGLGVIGSGPRTVTLPAQELRPGVYWIRLTQAGRSVLAKAVRTS
jgi:hypothetical protein